MAQDPAIRQMPVEDLETTFEHLGVTLTALGEGRLRLSMPASHLDAEQQSLIASALDSVAHHRSPTVAKRATHHSCATLHQRT